MRQPGLESLWRHTHGRQQHVRKIAHRGIGQPPLKVPLPQRLHRPEQEREDRQRQADGLGRRPPQIIRAEHIVSHPHDGEDARVDHRHGVQQRCHGRGRDRGRREPVVKREYGRLRAEPDKSQDKSQLHGPAVKHLKDTASVAEDPVHSVHRGQHDGHESQRRPSDRVGRIFSAGKHALMPSVVSHERDRHQRQHLDEYVHRDHICGIAHAQRHAVCHHIEGKKAIAPLISLHILEGVQQH